MGDKNLVQYKAYIDKESGSIVCNTLSYTLLTGSTIWLGNQIEVQNSPGAILTTPQQIEFFNASPGSNFNIGCAGGNFYVYNANTSLNVLEIDYTNSNVNINNQLSVNTASISTTLTANTINTTIITNPSGTSGTITVTGTVSANTINATGMQLNVTGNNPQGLSIIGVTGTSPSNDATQIFFQSNSSGTITTHWQLGPNFSTANPPDFWLYNNIGGYNTLQIHANTPLIDINSSINVTGNVTLSGSLTANTINATGATITTLTATSINPSPSSYSYAGTSGFAYIVQPFTGSGYKKVLLLFSSYVPGATDETYDFPVNFVGQYQVTSNINNLSYTLSSGSIEITNFSTTTTYNNGMTIEGW